METAPDRNSIIELGRLDSKITEILQMIDYIPEDIQRCHDDIAQQSELLGKVEQRQRIVSEKVGECEKLLALEEERISKADEIMTISRNQQAYLVAKRHREKSGKVLKQIQQVVEIHNQNLAQLQESATEIQTKLDSQKNNLRLGEKSLEAGRDNLNAELKDLRQKEKQLRTQIPNETLLKFDHLSSIGLQPVVIRVETSKCAACQMTFPDRLFQEMLHGEIHSCPNCQRFMLADPPTAAAQVG